MMFKGGDGKEWPHTFDAHAWVNAWLEQVRRTPSIATDRGTMLGWFANAIMRGYDHKAQEPPNDSRLIIDMLLRAGLNFTVTDTKVSNIPHNLDYDTVIQVACSNRAESDKPTNCIFLFKNDGLVFTGAE